MAKKPRRRELSLLEKEQHDKATAKVKKRYRTYVGITAALNEKLATDMVYQTVHGWFVERKTPPEFAVHLVELMDDEITLFDLCPWLQRPDQYPELQ